MRTVKLCIYIAACLLVLALLYVGVVRYRANAVYDGIRVGDTRADVVRAFGPADELVWGLVGKWENYCFGLFGEVAVECEYGECGSGFTDGDLVTGTRIRGVWIGQ
ncbi:MAG: hypothetical protein PF961_23350 [Planctomycetota bacterium]|jgi:hypothetical protein|nr:hypothetical protein [Planctomycetota bacterium]